MHGVFLFLLVFYSFVLLYFYFIFSFVSFSFITDWVSSLVDSGVIECCGKRDTNVDALLADLTAADYARHGGYDDIAIKLQVPKKIPSEELPTLPEEPALPEDGSVESPPVSIIDFAEREIVRSSFIFELFTLHSHRKLERSDIARLIPPFIAKRSGAIL